MLVVKAGIPLPFLHLVQVAVMVKEAEQGAHHGKYGVRLLKKQKTTTVISQASKQMVREWSEIGIVCLEHNRVRPP